MKNDRPRKGTPERYEWVLAKVREAWERAEAAGCERAKFGIASGWVAHRVAPYPANDDFYDLGGWEAVASAALGPAPTPLSAVPQGHAVKGVSTLVGPDGSIKAQWVKTREDVESPEEAIRRLLVDLPTITPVRLDPVPPPAGPTREDLLAVYPMGDPHVGLLAWKHESGESFDLEIAERLMTSAMRDLVLRGPRCARARIENLGDFFHFDNAHARTTKGEHTLDVDGRAAKVLGIGLRIMLAVIDAALERHERVDVDCIPGNHDGHTAIMLAIALASHYRNEPRVSIPLEASTRHYYRHGRVLIGTVHGDRTRVDDLGEIMAAERPADWGQTRHRVWHVGHVHHSTVTELRGCTVETFRTLAARDSWHAGQGYVSGRDMRRIVYHREHGEISREIAGLDYLEALAS